MINVLKLLWRLVVLCTYLLRTCDLSLLNIFIVHMGKVRVCHVQCKYPAKFNRSNSVTCGVLLCWKEQ